MTEEELQMIKEHIEIHARREPRAIKITQILWKAVEELEATKELQEENKWHDLRKDPKDLPKLKKGESFKMVLIYTKRFNYDWYDTASYSDGSFFINGEDEREKVIAWREVPKF